MPRMNRRTPVNEQAEANKRYAHESDKEESRKAALRKTYEGPVTMKELATGDSSRASNFMQNVGKEGVKRQQERIGEAGRIQQADYESAKAARQAKTSSKYK